MHALIIDDSKAMRMILRKILQQMGFETTEAGDGQAGLDALQSSADLDVVLVDWNMPVLNGLEFVKQVRANPALPQKPILVVTSETDPKYVVQIKDAGANSYIEKPFTPQKIVEQLRLVGVAN